MRRRRAISDSSRKMLPELRLSRGAHGPKNVWLIPSERSENGMNRGLDQLVSVTGKSGKWHAPVHRR